MGCCVLPTGTSPAVANGRKLLSLSCLPELLLLLLLLLLSWATLRRAARDCEATGAQL
jgi:hypothetical protein